MNKGLLCASLVAGAFLTCMGVAHAATETVRVAIPATTIPDSGYAGFVQVDQFDPTGGDRVLQQIDFELLIDFAGTVGIENLDPDFANAFQMRLLWEMELQRPNGSLLAGLEASRTVTGVLDPFDGVIDFAGFSGATFELTVEDVLGTGTTTAADDLTLFTGSGAVTLPLEVSYDLFVSNRGGGTFEVDAWDVTFAGDLTVTYTYIPEPMPLALLLVAGLVLLRRG